MIPEEANLDIQGMTLCGISRFDILARKAEMRMRVTGIKSGVAKVRAEQYATALVVALASKKD